VNDRFTLVDVPSEYTSQILDRMKRSRIGRQNASIRLASSVDADKTVENSTPREKRDFKSRKPARNKKFEGKKQSNAFATFAKRKKKKSK
jgi:hypothetical protein